MDLVLATVCYGFGVFLLSIAAMLGISCLVLPFVMIADGIRDNLL